MVVPPWIQLVGLPLLVIFAWVFASAASHAILVFLVAALISLLLNPVVRAIVEAGTPRPLAVLMVFSVFALAVVVASVALANTMVTQVQHLRANLPGYTVRVEHQVAHLQGFLDRRHIGVDLQDQGNRFLNQLEAKSSEISSQALDVGRNFITILAETIFNIILIVVVTIYMLLDAPRIGRFVTRLFPADSDVDPLFHRLEHSLVRYVRGQLLASAVMGVSAAVGLWVLGVTGIWPAAVDLAVVFGLIVAITEFAPSIGPVLGAVPPVVVALFDGIGPALAVTAFFVVLHQVEGHIVIPRLMGAAIAVHPLLVIFGIVAGAQILGWLGVLLVLPLLAVGRELLLFVRERFELERWPEAGDTAGGATLAVAGALVGATGATPAAPPDAVAAVAAAAAPPRTLLGNVRRMFRPRRRRSGR